MDSGGNISIGIYIQKASEQLQIAVDEGQKGEY